VSIESPVIRPWVRSGTSIAAARQGVGHIDRIGKEPDPRLAVEQIDRTGTALLSLCAEMPGAGPKAEAGSVMPADRTKVRMAKVD